MYTLISTKNVSSSFSSSSLSSPFSVPILFFLLLKIRIESFIVTKRADRSMNGMRRFFGVTVLELLKFSWFERVQSGGKSSRTFTSDRFYSYELQRGILRVYWAESVIIEEHDFKVRKISSVTIVEEWSYRCIELCCTICWNLQLRLYFEVRKFSFINWTRVNEAFVRIKITLICFQLLFQSLMKVKDVTLNERNNEKDKLNCNGSTLGYAISLTLIAIRI